MPLTGVRHAVMVGSGKGGVGKTTVAVNLALALSRLGRRVGLFDADLYGPNVPVMLGVRRKVSSGGMVPISRGNRPPYIRPLRRFGIDVMSMGFLVGDSDAVGPDPRFVNRLVLQTLRDVSWDVDVLVIDSPPGTGEPQTTLVREVQLDGAVVVTTPGELSLMDAGRSVAAFQRDGLPVLGVIENMAYIRCPGCGETILMHETGAGRTADDLTGEVLARIPMTPSAARTIGTQHGLLEPANESETDRQFVAAASALLARLEGEPRP